MDREWDFTEAAVASEDDELEVEREADETHIRERSLTPSQNRLSTIPPDITGGAAKFQEQEE